MKLLVLTIALAFFAAVSHAQDLFFPSKEGTVLTYNVLDKKDKVTSTFKYTIQKVTGNASNLDITYLYESIDPKGKQSFSDVITIHKKGDILYLDMSNFVNKAVFQQNGQMPVDVQIKGNNMEIPSNLSPGQALPDANVEMAMKMGFINMKIAADVTNRKVEALEDVAVKAGNFKSYKISSDVKSSAMGIKASGKSTQWYAKGLGLIKSVNTDEKGNSTGGIELVEVKN